MSKKSNARLRREQTNAEFKARRGADYFDYHLPPPFSNWNGVPAEDDDYEYDEDDCE